MIFSFLLFKKKNFFLKKRNFPGKSLIVIDRDKAALDKITAVCKEHKIDCFTAHDPKRGLELVTAHKPYAAVLSADFAPDLPRLRSSHEEYKNLLVIILAEEKWAGSRAALVDSLIKTGAQEFVSKPINPNKLIGVIERLFTGKPITSKSTAQ
ncbi:hypothetical protein [Chitinophaga sp. 212800010-3]|uniref:hypothetical protein n=1 Tax=unclassified Chitinophaga TaxID=2619133 RepID=UPI002DEAD510|nr:hypothetical protein [Chitinophaga sp. 212800010-3]